MSFLPTWLQERLTTLPHPFTLHELKNAYHTLSTRYREGGVTGDIVSGYGSDAEAVAYVLARLPATYGVIEACLQRFPEDFIPKNIIDLGAGAGTATLACLNKYPGIEGIMVEAESKAIQWGEYLLAPYPKVTYYQKNLLAIQEIAGDFPSGDLVILSYVLGEMGLEEALNLLDFSLKHTKAYLLIALPGTPRDYALLMKLRAHILKSGEFSVVAPCPHDNLCPLGSTGKDRDWCHFSVRVPRSSLHQKVKTASLPYEDEKYVYLILKRGSLARKCPKRIIKNPHHGKNHGELTLCTEKGIEILKFTKGKSSNYALLKKRHWGDTL